MKNRGHSLREKGKKQLKADRAMVVGGGEEGLGLGVRKAN